MASLEAQVRSKLRDELSGELYGCRPTDLSYGTCTISVPKPENRQAGEVNRPFSVWVFEAPENPEKHFMLKHVEEYPNKDAFFGSLRKQIAEFGRQSALLFIHGYNVSFEDAMFRTAQLAVDLKFPGAPIAIRWPSCADPVKYTFDEQNAEVSIPALREFLEDLATAQRRQADAHHRPQHGQSSAGRGTARTWIPKRARTQPQIMFREIVLAAPDIDSRVFKSQMLPHDSGQRAALHAVRLVARSGLDDVAVLSTTISDWAKPTPELIVAERHGHDRRLAWSTPACWAIPTSATCSRSSATCTIWSSAGKRPTERVGLEPELLGELIVLGHQAGRANRRRVGPRR